MELPGRANSLYNPEILTSGKLVVHFTGDGAGYRKIDGMSGGIDFAQCYLYIIQHHLSCVAQILAGQLDHVFKGCSGEWSSHFRIVGTINGGDGWSTV